MNRQYKRMMKKQEAQRKSAPRPQIKPQTAPAKKKRTPPIQFLKEVVAELKKVAWPSRQEVYATTVVVILTSIFFGFYLYGLDIVMSQVFTRILGR